MNAWIDNYMQEIERQRVEDYYIVAVYAGNGEWKECRGRYLEEDARIVAQKNSSHGLYLYWCIMNGRKEKLALFYKGKEIVNPDA